MFLGYMESLSNHARSTCVGSNPVVGTTNHKPTANSAVHGDGLVSHFTCDVNKFDSSPILISDLNPDLEPDP